MGMKFENREAESSWIEDNGHLHLAEYDKNGLAYYSDRSLVSFGAERKRPRPASAAKKRQAAAARNMMKDLGYRALSGTSKQKAWAESIRKSIVDALPDDIRSTFADAPFKRATFWIENRNRTASEFAHFAREDVQLLEAIYESHEAETHVILRDLRNERAKLHIAWNM